MIQLIFLKSVEKGLGQISAGNSAQTAKKNREQGILKLGTGSPIIAANRA